MQALVDEALADLIEKRKNGNLRTHAHECVPSQPRQVRAPVQKACGVTDYLTLAEILAIHLDQIKRYGGTHGVRDPGLLESALFRPETGYYADLVEEAAALWESMSQNHPFLDGNKRTAFAVTYTFLAINGAQLTASSSAALGILSSPDSYRKESIYLRQTLALASQTRSLRGISSKT